MCVVCERSGWYLLAKQRLRLFPFFSSCQSLCIRLLEILLDLSSFSLSCGQLFLRNSQ